MYQCANIYYHHIQKFYLLYLFVLQLRRIKNPCLVRIQRTAIEVGILVMRWSTFNTDFAEFLQADTVPLVKALQSIPTCICMYLIMIRTILVLTHYIADYNVGDFPVDTCEITVILIGFIFIELLVKLVQRKQKLILYHSAHHLNMGAQNPNFWGCESHRHPWKNHFRCFAPLLKMDIILFMIQFYKFMTPMKIKAWKLRTCW